MVFFLCTRPNDFHKETISKMGKFFSSILKTQNLFLNPTIPQPKDNSIMVLLYFYSSFMNILSDKNQKYQGFYLYIPQHTSAVQTISDDISSQCFKKFHYLGKE